MPDIPSATSMDRRASFCISSGAMLGSVRSIMYRGIDHLLVNGHLVPDVCTRFDQFLVPAVFADDKGLCRGVVCALGRAFADIHEGKMMKHPACTLAVPDPASDRKRLHIMEARLGVILFLSI